MKNQKWDYNPSGNLMDQTTRRLMCSALLSDNIIKVYDVGDDAFCTFNNSTVIHTEKYSTAETFAKENNIKVDYKSASVGTSLD